MVNQPGLVNSIGLMKLSPNSTDSYFNPYWQLSTLGKYVNNNFKQACANFVYPMSSTTWGIGFAAAGSSYLAVMLGNIA